MPSRHDDVRKPTVLAQAAAVFWYGVRRLPEMPRSRIERIQAVQRSCLASCVGYGDIDCVGEYDVAHAPTANGVATPEMGDEGGCQWHTAFGRYLSNSVGDWSDRRGTTRFDAGTFATRSL